jgi:hypothetical protein
MRQKFRSFVQHVFRRKSCSWTQLHQIDSWTLGTIWFASFYTEMSLVSRLPLNKLHSRMAGKANPWN